MALEPGTSLGGPVIPPSWFSNTRRVGLRAAAIASLLALSAACGAPEEPSGRPAGPPAVEVFEATILELQEAMQAGTVTSRALVERYLARIAAYDDQGPQLNAMISLNPNAIAAAEALDAERAAQGPRGPLHGIPVVLKDNFDTADMPTTGGSIALAGVHPTDDAFQVRKLREAGAVIIGKTNLHELAAGITTISSLGGQTRNPYDPARNPGGSSGGTGAAVAANFAVFGMGSDTCGSIRIPASHHSLVGLRGTSGLSSRDGIIPLSHTQDIGGPLARNVTDLAIALDATVGPDSSDPITARSEGRLSTGFRDALDAGSLSGTRFGVLTTLFGDAGEEEPVTEIVLGAIEELKAQGADAIDVEIADYQALMQDSGVIGTEFKFDLIDYLEDAPDSPVASLTDIVDRGLAHVALERNFRRRTKLEGRDTEEHRQALAKQESIRRALLALMDAKQLDAIIYPTLRRQAAPIGQRQVGSNCQLSAHSGFPAITVPAGFTDDGMPVGMELLGRPFSDPELVGFAYAFEQATGHHTPPSTTPPLVDGVPPAAVSFDVSLRGADEVTPVSTQASAEARFTFDAVHSELRYELAVTGLDVDELRFGHIHRGDVGTNGPVLYQLLDGDTLISSGTLRLTGRDRRDLEAGSLYLNVHSSAHPAGELRGQLQLP